MKPVDEQVWIQVRGQVHFVGVQRQIWYQIYRQVADQVWSKVDNQVYDQTWRQVQEDLL